MMKWKQEKSHFHLVLLFCTGSMNSLFDARSSSFGAPQLHSTGLEGVRQRVKKRRIMNNSIVYLCYDQQVRSFVSFTLSS